LPATQAVHESAGPVNPALQAADTQAVPPLGEVEPAGQVMHVVAPLLEYVFEGHEKHCLVVES